MPSRARAPWLVAGLLAVLALAGGAWWLLRPAPPAPAAPVAKAPPRSAPEPAPSAPALPPPAVERVRPPPPPEVPTTGALAGRLVDESHLPVAGRVELLAGQLSPLGGPLDASRLDLVATVGDDGRFELHDVPAGENLLVRATGETFAETYSGPWTVRRERTTELGDLLVDRGHAVVGLVLGPDGRPLPGARVELDGGPGRRPSRVVLADDEGAFGLEFVPRPPLTLTASVEGYAPGTAVVPSGAETQARETSVVITLERGTTLGGVVRALATGEPVAGATVEAEPVEPGVGGLSTVTDAEGRFVLEGVAQRAYSVAADAPGLLTERTVVPASALGQELVLALRSAGTLSGRVVDPAGEPVEAFDVLLRHGTHRTAVSPDGRSQRVHDGGGRFAFDDLDAGWYVLEVWSKGHALTESAPVQVKAGHEITGVEIELQPAAVLAGRVVTDDGQPVEGAEVSLHHDRLPDLAFLRAHEGEPRWARSTRTHADGTFELDDVSARTFQVQVDHPDMSVQRRDGVTAQPGQRTELEPFVLQRAGLVHGVALDGSGQPVPRVQVSLWRPGATSSMVTTNGAGEFVFARVLPGSYHLEAMRPDVGLEGLSQSIATVAAQREGTLPPPIVVAPGQEVYATVRVR